MIRSILVTAALLAGWSVLMFINVVYLSAHIGHISPACGYTGQGCTSDEVPRDIATWLIGLLVIGALRGGAVRVVHVSRSIEMRPALLAIVVAFGLAGGIVALTLVVTARGGVPPVTVVRSPPVGTAWTTYTVSVDPATGFSSWKGTDLGPDGRFQRSFFVPTYVMPVPWPAGVPLRDAIPAGVAIGLLVGGVALLLFGPRNQRLVSAPASITSSPRSEPRHE